MKQPKISIIVPIYKAEDSIRRLLDSFEKQPCQDIEFFLIDNASPDKCGEICKEYVERDSRFTLHTLEVNIGYIRARQYGIDNCAGEYIGFSDSDDYIPEEIYDKIVESIENNEVDFLSGGYYGVVGDANTYYSPSVPAGIYEKNEINSTILPSMFGSNKKIKSFKGFMWKNFYRKNIINSKITFVEELKPVEDQIFNIDFIKKCNKVMIIDLAVYYYVMNEASITNSEYKNFDFFTELKKIALLNASKLERENDKYNEFIVNNMIWQINYLILQTAKNHSLKKGLSLLDNIDDWMITFIKTNSFDTSKPIQKFFICHFMKVYFVLLKFYLMLRGDK